MGNPREVRRDFDALERRRMAAMALIAGDWNNPKIGCRLQASNQTVSRWRKEHAEGGKAATRKSGRAGRKPILTARQLQPLTRTLLAGVGKMGNGMPPWTDQRVAVAIEGEFGVRYHSGHVWRIPRSLGWSPQRPCGPTIERHEQAIAEWKCTKQPAIKTMPHLGGARPYAGAVAPFQLEDLSLISGPTIWNLCFEMCPESIKAPHVIVFLRHPPRRIPGCPRIVWGGLAAHRSNWSRRTLPDSKDASTWNGYQPTHRSSIRRSMSGLIQSNSNCPTSAPRIRGA